MFAFLGYFGAINFEKDCNWLCCNLKNGGVSGSLTGDFVLGVCYGEILDFKEKDFGCLNYVNCIGKELMYVNWIRVGFVYLMLG